MSNPVDLTTFSTMQVAELRGQVRMNVAMLDRRGPTRTTQQDQDLREQKALLNRLTRELKTRIVQLPLL